MRRVSVSEAWSRKYPEWITLVVATDEEGRPNVMPVGWCMICSGTPPMMAVAINTGAYTHHLIEKGGEFVLAFPAPGMGPDIWYSGTHSGRDGDKRPHLSLGFMPASEVRAPLIGGAVANLECRLVQQVRTGDHSTFVGQVVAAHVEDEAPGRLVNFGNNCYALARPVEGTVYQAG